MTLSHAGKHFQINIFEGCLRILITKCMLPNDSRLQRVIVCVWNALTFRLDFILCYYPDTYSGEAVRPGGPPQPLRFIIYYLQIYLFLWQKMDKLCELNQLYSYPMGRLHKPQKNFWDCGAGGEPLPNFQVLNVAKNRVIKKIKKCSVRGVVQNFPFSSFVC